MGYKETTRDRTSNASQGSPGTPFRPADSSIPLSNQLWRILGTMRQHEPAGENEKYPLRQHALLGGHCCSQFRLRRRILMVLICSRLDPKPRGIKRRKK